MSMFATWNVPFRESHRSIRSAFRFTCWLQGEFVPFPLPVCTFGSATFRVASPTPALCESQAELLLLIIAFKSMKFNNSYYYMESQGVLSRRRISPVLALLDPVGVSSGLTFRYSSIFAMVWRSAGLGFGYLR
jgi:hypothetical protein